MKIFSLICNLLIDNETIENDEVLKDKLNNTIKFIRYVKSA